MDKYSRKLAWAVAVASLVVTWPAVSGAQQNQGGEPWNQNQGNQNQQDQQQRDREREERERQQRDQQRNQGDQQRDQDQQRRDQQQDRQSQDNRGSEDAALGIALGYSDGQGARVSRVFRDSPAQQMGVRQGDRIVAVNGQQIESSDDLMREVENQNPGDEIRIEVERNGNREELTGRLESREEAFEHRDSQGQRTRRSWSEQGGYASSDHYGGSGRQQNVRAELDRLERQVSQIQRELENLRFAIDEQGQQQRWSSDDRRDQSYDRGRESTARYEDDNSGRRMNQQTNYDRWDEQGGQRRSDRREIHRSSGGEVGEDRQEVGSSEINRDW